MSTVADDLPVVQRIDVLQIQPGDVLAVIPARRLDMAEAADLRDELRSKAPGHEVVVLEPGFELAAVRPAAEDRVEIREAALRRGIMTMPQIG